MIVTFMVNTLFGRKNQNDYICAKTLI